MQKTALQRALRFFVPVASGLCSCLVLSAAASAMSSYTTPNRLIRLDYYGAGEGFTGKWYLENLPEDEKIFMTSQGELPDWQKERINVAADYWDGLLKGTKTAKQPATLAVTVTQDYENAQGQSSYSGAETGGQTISVTTPNAVLNHGKVLTEENVPAGYMAVGTLLFPAEAEPDRYDTPLPQDSGFPLTATMIHEIGHAMGIDSSAYFIQKSFTKDAYVYDSYLHDWRGVQAKPGMEIKTPNHEVASEPYFDLPEFATDLEMNKSPYFSGPHVREVLEGAELRTYNYGLVEKQDQKVPGLQVTGNETYREVGEDRIDLSHIELRNGLMSHKYWRNYVSLMEAELALFQDLGYTIDRRDYFGRSVYGDGRTIVNDSPFYARNADGTAYVAGAYNESPYGMGLHIYGNENTVFQNAPLMTKGMAAVGIRIDGCGNHVTVNNGVNVQADGLNGNGILVAFGKDHTITLAEGSKVTAAGEGGIGAAFDFGQNMVGNDLSARASYAARVLDYYMQDPELLDTDGPLVSDFTVRGELSGKKAAIDISDNAFVKNIHIGTGARLTGDIVSRWVYDDGKITTLINGEVFADPAMQRQYDGDDELTTRLSFEGTGLAYDGNITGADNMRLSVSGNLTYGGTANVLSATVEKGGSLFGGTYGLIPDGAVRSASSAVGYSLPYQTWGIAKELKNVGLFTNHGTIGAATNDTTLRINGDLLSDGTLLAQAGGSAGYIDVSGRAQIDGSEAKLVGATPLPGEKYTVLTAGEGIEGDTRIPAGTPYEVSAMMSAKNEIENGVLSLSFEAANNLGTADPAQNETFAAMSAMYAGLRAADDPRYAQMNPLFAMDAATAKDTLSAVGSPMAVKSMAASQRDDAAGRVLSSRLSENAENDFWAKFGKSWGHLRHGTNAHSSTALLGWDRKIAPRWKFGVFAEYGRTSLSDKTAGSEVREQRFGLYADHVKGGNETMLYVDYGWMRTKLHRSIAPLGLPADATYHSQILELGGEYRYDLHAGTNASWHVRPYVNAQLSRLWQNGYAESGAGVFGHEAQNAHNDYFAAGAGIEFKRGTKSGDLAIRLGLRHAFAGAEPKLRFRYSGDGANSYDMRTAQDKTHFVCSLGGEAKFAHGWTIAGEAGLSRGAHDKEWSCALTVRKTW